METPIIPYVAVVIMIPNVIIMIEPSWLYSFGSWMYEYICNQWLSPPKL